MEGGGRGGGRGGGQGLQNLSPPVPRSPASIPLSPVLFRAALVPCKLAESKHLAFIRDTRTHAAWHFMTYDITIVNGFTISPVVSLFFSLSANFRLISHFPSFPLPPPVPLPPPILPGSPPPPRQDDVLSQNDYRACRILNTPVLNISM